VLAKQGRSQMSRNHCNNYTYAGSRARGRFGSGRSSLVVAQGRLGSAPGGGRDHGRRDRGTVWRKAPGVLRRTNTPDDVVIDIGEWRGGGN